MTDLQKQLARFSDRKEFGEYAFNSLVCAVARWLEHFDNGVADKMVVCFDKLSMTYETTSQPTVKNDKHLHPVFSYGSYVNSSLNADIVEIVDWIIKHRGLQPSLQDVK